MNLNAIISYLKSIKKRNICMGAIAAVVLMIFSFINMKDILSFRKAFIVIFLSVSTGIFIALPRIKNTVFNLVCIALYLIFVPKKMLYRIEIPLTGNINELRNGAILANILIILLVFAFFLFVTQRVNLALGIGSLLILTASLTNFYVYSYSGTLFTFNDILAIKTAATVILGYSLFLTPELTYSILYFIFFAVLGFKLDLPLKGVRYHILITSVSAAYVAFFFFFWKETSYFEDHELKGVYWNTSVNESVNGFMLSFLLNIDEMKLEKPSEYSVERVNKIVLNITKKEAYDEVRPNIIFIMNEAWSDLRVLGNLETSVEYMPFTDSLCKNTVKGYTYVNILGGLTANSEFEALTGDTTSFLAPGVVVYQMQADHEMPSIATILSNNGYQTMAMHPNVDFAWNRDRVYEYFGFDEFIDVNSFKTEYLYTSDGNMISDECNFNEIIWQYEHKEKDTPLFLFDVTIQNHSPYYYNTDIDVYLKKVGNTDAADLDYTTDVETYLSLIKKSDEAFERLIGYFEKEDEPTVICMFGDHQPVLNDGFYEAIYKDRVLTDDEQTALKYMTPYVIWANYDIDIKDYGNISANYLGAVLLDVTKVRTSQYFSFLLDLMTYYPEISHRNVKSIIKDERITDYRILEYNHLVSKNIQTSVFN